MKLALALALTLSLAGACKKEPASPSPAAPGRKAMRFPVEVAPVASRPVEYAVDAVGSIDAFETVQVTARVQGVVERVRFAEGETVSPGRVLAEIEPQRFRLAAAAARASLEKAQASRADAQASLDRREKAVAGAPGLIPAEEIATFRTRVATAAAEEAAARAALAQADLNLRDAHVRAPTAGVIESRRVQTGQYVQPGSIITTLVRRDPLLLRFNVAEAEAAQVRPGMTARFRLRDSDEAHEARVVHVAQQADPATRMVPVTAEVRGEAKQTLRPGAFAEVVVPIGAPRPATVVPQTAVRPTERGFVAFVAEGQGDAARARERILTLGLRTPDGQVQVKKGLAPGELVVVRGAEALREGASIAVSPRRPPPAEETPRELAP